MKGLPIALWLGVAASLCAVLQLMLGASLMPLALCVSSIGVGLIAIAKLGPYNAAAWVAFFYVTGNALVALYAKTLLGQPLDSNLFAPTESFFVVAVASLGLAAALWVAKTVPVGKPIVKPIGDPRTLSWLSWLSFIFGSIAWYVNATQNDLRLEDQAAFGGAAIFRDLLFLAVIARSAMLLEASGNRRSFDWPLAAIMGFAVFAGLVDNTKTGIALPILSYFLTVLVYRRAVPVRVALSLLLGGMVFVTALAPAVQGMRALGQQGLTFGQRIEFVVDNFDALVGDQAQIAQLRELGASTLSGGYYSYFGESGAGQLLVGRYASVQQIDPVIASVDLRGQQGMGAILPAFERLLPAVLAPNKPEYSEEFVTLLHYGLIDPYGGKHPTLPVAGQAYAAAGVLGAMTIPFLTFLVLFLVMKKVGWSLDRNVFAIFILVSFVLVYAGQGSFGQYMGEALRFLPSFVAVLWLMRKLAQVRFTDRRPQPTV